MDQVVVSVRSPHREPAALIIARDRCKGCGFCVEYCPKGVLALDEGCRNTQGFATIRAEHPADCRACALCELYCPDQAIFVRHHVRERVA